MPDTLNKSLSDVLAEARAQLEDLRLLGLVEIGMAAPAVLAPCPPGVVGADRGGAAECRQETLDEMRAELGNCQTCPLCDKRRSIPFGSGNAHARLVIVCEPPPREEEADRNPCAGEAGELLDRMLLAIGLQRNEVYLLPALKCATSDTASAAALCRNVVQRQLAVIAPQAVLVMGEAAVAGLFGAGASVAAYRGGWREWQGFALLVSYSPQQLLRQPADKRQAWEDLKTLQRRLRAME